MSRRTIVATLLAVAALAIVLALVRREHRRAAAPPPGAPRAPAPAAPGAGPIAGVVKVPPPLPNRPTHAGIALWFVALGDDGRSGPRVGCGDSAVPITRAMELGDTTTAGRIVDTLGALFRIHDRAVGPARLYNALATSALRVGEVTTGAGRITVAIAGTLSLGGECDGPRARDQIERTVRQFPAARDAAILLGGRPLAEAFSLR